MNHELERRANAYVFESERNGLRDESALLVGDLLTEIKRLDTLINNPHTQEFIEAVKLEATHQRERWTADHDAGKTPEDWLFLIGYLGTKATQAERYGDSAKYLHHIITVAAACLNWHAHATGANTQMRPGIDAEQSDG